MSDVWTALPCRAFVSRIRVLSALLVVFATLLTVANQAQAAGSIDFDGPTAFGVGSTPRSVAIGDLNGDTDPDLVSANGGSSNVTVLLGDGSGGFAAAPGSPFAVGSSPTSIAIDNLNGDTDPDLVTANTGSSNVTVLLGDGSGGFASAPGSPFGVGSLPMSVASGDLNGDTDPDLVTANFGSDNVTVLLGDGSGGFAAAPGSPFAVGTNPMAVGIGILSSGSTPDLVTSNVGSSDVTLLLGDGSGGFSAASSSPFAVGAFPASLAIGNLNGGSRADLVTANAGDNNVTVLLGSGIANLNEVTTSPFAVGTFPFSVALGDLNRDTDLDLVTANATSYDVTVLLGRGNGRFDANAGGPNFVPDPRSVAVGDLNGDTRLDVVTANAGFNIVTVLFNTATLITGKRLLINDNVNPANKKLSILSKDTAIRLGANGSSDDPTIVGLTVRVESASAGFDTTYTLPASGWDVIGQPGQNKGYRYKDSQQVFGPIKDGMLRRGHIQFTGKGSGLGSNAAINANPVNVNVAAGSERYCMTFGGTIRFSVNKFFSAANAPTSAGCPG